MTSGFSGDFFYGSGGGNNNTRLQQTTMMGIGGNQNNINNNNNNNVIAPYFRQQQQHIQQQQGVFSADQIAQRRADLLMGKRSFADFQSYQQQIHLQQQQQQLQQQQQQQHPFGLLQKQQQQQQQQQQNQPLSLLLQQQYLMRSVKQRTNNLASSPISPIDLCSNNNTTTNSLSSARFGVPVYQQQLRSQQHQQQQQPVSLFNHPHQINPSSNNNNNNSLFQTCNTPITSFMSSNNNNNNNSLLLNPVQNNQAFSVGFGYSNLVPNLIQPKPEPQVLVSEIGFPNSSVNLNSIQPKLEPEPDHKILNTLQELEKQLLLDDDDDTTNQDENDAVSVITNSEWSETFQNLMDPSPSPNPSPSNFNTPPGASASTSGSNNNNNNNNMISPSPTSSTSSSCCSTSASPTGPPPPSLSAKQLISEASIAISDGKIETATEVLNKLAQVANVRGNSEQRLAYYMGNALRSRALPNENPPPVMELYGKEQMSAMYTLYDLSPCFKFGLLAANLVMLEAITSALQESLKIHVVDFDVGHGGQYMNLLRALAERRSQSGAGLITEMRVTVVETELGNNNGGATTEIVKERLVMLAEKLGIKLRFEVVTRAIHELTRESLGCEEGEAVVVNFAFKLYRVPDESVSMENLRDELLRRVKGLSPRAVTLVEQDMNGNTAPFVTRVNEACVYYGALFDSLEATFPREHVERVRAEDALGRKMGNAVACEGRERIERAEVFGKWRARMGMAGFELKPLSQSVAESMRAKLNSARGGNPGFSVKEENGGVGFGWVNRTLTVASAWR